MDDGYIDRYPCALGRLVGNLSSLEWVLRNVLYVVGLPDSAFPEGVSLRTAKPGERLPLNALTSWDTLEKLIKAFNQISATPIDSELKILRDAFAHGRLLGADEWDQFALMKFFPPDSNGVVVEARYDLTLEWMNEQIMRVGEAIDIAKARLRELQLSPPSRND